MPPRTLVTGADGLVGRVLRARLFNLPLTFAGRARVDVDDGAALREAIHGHEQILHLASPIRGRMMSPEMFQASVRMAGAVLDAAKACAVKRIIIPSSVLATSMTQLGSARRARISDSQPPETEYGRTRLEIEALARAASERGIEVVCVRLGAVRRPDFPSHEAHLRTHWLSHEDCAALFGACLIAPVVAGRFSLFYAVSDLPGRVLDTSNPFDWTPRTRAVGFRRTLVARLWQINTTVRGRLRLRTRVKPALDRKQG